jgi:predicted aspartyl protease
MRKLVTYINRLKKRRNAAKPGGRAHTPRAKRSGSQADGAKTLGTALGVILLCVGLLCFFSPVDPTTVIVNLRNQLRQQPAQLAASAQTSRDEPAPPHAELQTPSLQPSEKSYYSFTDKTGVVHIVDDVGKVPQQYLRSMKETHSSTTVNNVTTVIIDGDQVLVPVTLSYHGRAVEAHLLLDTGANITAINEKVAASLGVESSDMNAGSSTVADGRSIGSYSFVTDSLTVGPRSQYQLQVTIIPGSGGTGYDGLLGMNFLKNFRFHLDFSRSVIEWGT